MFLTGRILAILLALVPATSLAGIGSAVAHGYSGFAKMFATDQTGSGSDGAHGKTGFAELFAPAGAATGDPVSWKVSQRGDTLVFTGMIDEGWHVYSVSDPVTPAYVTFDAPDGWTPDGEVFETKAPEELGGNKVFFGRTEIAQIIAEAGKNAKITGTLTYQACNDVMCTPPIDWDFTFYASEVDPSEHQTYIKDPERGGGADGTSIWALILEAILWGFAMLLTPCVFPMVPMTVSFFLKGSSSPAAGRFKAFMYGLFIVLLYTVPICIIIGLTWLIGGEVVTADIFNWLSTHWLPNIIFFLVFMVFAASFFGAFEITLPSKLVNDSDKKSGREGLGGIFFLALTLVLVSFSCTGPIVGTVLIKSTRGEFWTPMVTMLAFSVAFALPFTVFALFPSVLKKMKSGGWLNSVKVTLGFIELALGLKFLSVADQTYHWGILDREIYLAIWIVVFTLLGFYLLGKIRFKYDEELRHIGIGRLFLAIVDFTFVVYMIPGMWGAPLKALSGYLPPIETQDFVLGNVTSEGQPNDFGLSLPNGLNGYFSLDKALAASAKEGKPVFVDITGHGCVNCREMEQRVWSDPRVRDMMDKDYVIVALYTDDKSKLPEKDWVTTESGKVLKDLGRVNSRLVRDRFGVNSQPSYVILDSKGSQLLPTRGYNLDVNAFLSFLQDGVAAFNEGRQD